MMSSHLGPNDCTTNIRQLTRGPHPNRILPAAVFIKCLPPNPYFPRLEDTEREECDDAGRGSREAVKRQRAFKAAITLPRGIQPPQTHNVAQSSSVFNIHHILAFWDILRVRVVSWMSSSSPAGYFQPFHRLNPHASVIQWSYVAIVPSYLW